MTRESGASTIAMLQAFVAHADDAYERVAEFLAGLIAAPGSASLDWATEVASDLGTLTAGLHAALATPPPDAPDLAPRDATREELRAWRHDALRQLNLAVPAVAAVDREVARELEGEASAIAARVSRFEAVATTPTVMRIHADLHLGQILVADDGYRVVDFEGEPLRPIEDRRRPDSPLRDVASLLRSLDHVARSARRRAELRSGPLDRPGLDIDAWIDLARERFLAAYVTGLQQAGAPITVDLDLLDAFEVAKECYEFALRGNRAAIMAVGATRRDALAAGARRGSRAMSGERTRVDELTEDILAAPDELAAAIDLHTRGIAALPEELLERPRWLLIGMGSSGFAARDVAAALRSVGHDAIAEIASASDAAPPGADTLAIVISNSGRTAETVAAAARHRHRSGVIALTSEPASALAAEADAVLPLVGERAETSGIATLSSRSTVAALRLLAGRVDPSVAGAGIATAIPSLETLLDDRATWLARAGDVLANGRPIHVLGDGLRLGSVEQAALMLREAPRLEAFAWDTGDWLHVGLYTLLPGDAVLLFSGSPADDEAIGTAHARGGKVVVVGDARDDSDLHVPLPVGVADAPAIRSLVESAVPELLAAELWARAEAITVSEEPAAG